MGGTCASAARGGCAEVVGLSTMSTACARLPVLCEPPPARVHEHTGWEPCLGRARPCCRGGGWVVAAADGATGTSSLAGSFIPSLHACAPKRLCWPQTRRPLRPHSKADVVPSPPVSAPGWLSVKHTPPLEPPPFWPLRARWTSERVCCGRWIFGIFLRGKLRARGQTRQMGARRGRRHGKTDGCAPTLVTPACQTLQLFGGSVTLTAMWTPLEAFCGTSRFWWRPCQP